MDETYTKSYHTLRQAKPDLSGTENLNSLRLQRLPFLEDIMMYGLATTKVAPDPPQPKISFEFLENCFFKSLHAKN